MNGDSLSEARPAGGRGGKGGGFDSEINDHARMGQNMGLWIAY